ncbi:uncharacterized protein MELLADRAFT_84667 [Melampsora larici-populina 98AG31]|uniref:Uncharacterized protein n=1 Tax=Melampsora larici-populina (strain 98AG31 / pathotype 3-4-7) TaxID=747676 RepID=F4RGE3_MELLP|nr:uncharacterized protein MELLADRAFT_84667 [Melampsora larici-populina 98AG31]EGG08665.1 hypothetical protein MELLADRAFT_84667 [Melampsora larici-populina 98AG31]
MRFRQMFVTINMLMDHTASSPILHRLGMASPTRPTELADKTVSQSSGVVWGATTQAYHDSVEEAAQMEAMAKNHGPPDYLMYHDRKMQQVGSPYTPMMNVPGGAVTEAPPVWTQQQELIGVGVIGGLLISVGVLWKCLSGKVGGKHPCEQDSDFEYPSDPEADARDRATLAECAARNFQPKP